MDTEDIKLQLRNMRVMRAGLAVFMVISIVFIVVDPDAWTSFGLVMTSIGFISASLRIDHLEKQLDTDY